MATTTAVTVGLPNIDRGTYPVTFNGPVVHGRARYMLRTRGATGDLMIEVAARLDGTDDQHFPHLPTAPLAVNGWNVTAEVLLLRADENSPWVVHEPSAYVYDRNDVEPSGTVCRTLFEALQAGATELVTPVRAAEHTLHRARAQRRSWTNILVENIEEGRDITRAKEGIAEAEADVAAALARLIALAAPDRVVR